MSKKAEERALEAYPHFTAENIAEVTNARHFFAEGYEEAEKEGIIFNIPKDTMSDGILSNIDSAICSLHESGEDVIVQIRKK